MTLSLTSTQANTIKAIIRFFETSQFAGAYGQQTRARGDRGQLSYGVIQFTLASGSLHQLAETYCAIPGALYTDRFSVYMDALRDKDFGLNVDKGFEALLSDAGTDPAMHTAQDQMEHHVYFGPACRDVETRGGKSPLLMAIAYDISIHSGLQGWKTFAGGVEAQHGTIAATDERRFIQAVLQEREKRLAGEGGNLPKTVYRPQTFRNILKVNNSLLKLPLTVRKKRLTSADLPDPNYTRTPAPEPGQERLLYVSSYGFPRRVSGEDVRRVQQQLQAAGCDVGQAGADGDFGTATCAAVKVFQTSSGLPITGLVDARTRAALVAPAASMETGADDFVIARDEAPIDWQQVGQPPLRPDTASRQINAAGLNIILAHHPASPVPYKVASQTFAIGFGHKTNVDAGLRIDRAQAYAFLYEDLAQVEQIVSHAIRDTLSDNQFAALVSLAFDLEPKRFQTCAVVRQLNEGDIARAIYQMNRLTRRGGDIDLALVARRTEEVELFLTPDDEEIISAVPWEIEGTIDNRTRDYKGRPQRHKDNERLTKSRTIRGTMVAGTGGLAALASGVSEPDTAGPVTETATEVLPGFLPIEWLGDAWGWCKATAADPSSLAPDVAALLAMPVTKAVLGILLMAAAWYIIAVRVDDWRNERR